MKMAPAMSGEMTLSGYCINPDSQDKAQAIEAKPDDDGRRQPSLPATQLGGGTHFQGDLSTNVAKNGDDNPVGRFHG
ncbi:MAG: hypothetical protein IPP21_09515 [Betaproteobacteria bacterium]|nr:hypothetical protein [Betaproteobacteria bacterium]